MPRFPLILCVLAACFGLEPARGQSVTISSAGPATAGGTTCVTVTSNSPSIAVSVEVNGVRLPASSVTVNPSGDGEWVVCFRIPAAACGGTVEITVTGGGEHASRLFPVQDSLIADVFG